MEDDSVALVPAQTHALELAFQCLETQTLAKYRVLPALSPNGNAVAVADKKRVTVYDTVSLEVSWLL